MSSEEIRIVHSETPIKEIWSRFSYFENEHNAKEFLKKFQLSEDDLSDTASSLAFTMKAAREYYESAGRVSLLTRPLLMFYGMAALSKVLFISTYGRKSPSKSHGLGAPKPMAFVRLSTRVQKDGTFPQFHSCYSKENLFGMRFAMKELLSLVPEVKVEYETVYAERSKALRITRRGRQKSIVDTELEKYGNLLEKLVKYFPQVIFTQSSKNAIAIFSGDVPTIRAVPGEEYIVLPTNKHGKDLLLPEMSVHFLIMYLLGMTVRYHTKEMGEMIKGEERGDIYIVQKFLETTERKFPNLVLNKLWNRNFVFVSPQFETKGWLDDYQLEQIYDYVGRRMGQEIRRLM